MLSPEKHIRNESLPFGGKRACKIIIAGGGTGGHIFPAIAIANAIRKRDPRIEILFIGAKGKMEMEKVPQAGYNIVGLDIAGFNRSSFIKNLSLPFKLLKSFFQVRNHFISFMPDAVIGVGGYSSFPVLRYAQAKGIPTFIHEANSFAGKSNMFLGKKATKIFTAIDGMDKFFPKEKLIVSGNPVRQAILEMSVNRDEAIGYFGLDIAKKTVLCVGGSLGAKSINEAIEAKLSAFGENGVQLIWQTGNGYAQRAKAVAEGKKEVWTGDFITRMDLAYAAADVVISRAGAMAIAELCVVKKPVVFVPYPHAAENHQMVNAQTLVNKSAGLLITDSEAKEKLVDTAISLLNDYDKQRMLEKNISAFAITNADDVVAEEVLKSLIQPAEKNG